MVTSEITKRQIVHVPLSSLSLKIPNIFLAPKLASSLKLHSLNKQLLNSEEIKKF